jgi:hypothetical protein
MLQIVFESMYIYLSVIFIFFGIFAFGWLVVHMEHARHHSWFKVISALVLGSLFFGFGIHFLLLTAGA